MTKLDSEAPSVASPQRREITIYRDIPQILSPALPRIVGSDRSSVQAFAPEHELVGDGIFLGFAGLTFVAVAYGFIQLWSLVSGNALEHAVQLLVR